MRLRLAFILCMLFLLVGCDHATKHWAESSLRAAPPVEVVAGVLDLRYTANRDTAFSLSRWVLPAPVKRPVLIGLGCFGLLVVGLCWARRRRAAATEHAAYLLLAAGAAGNVGDRIGRGYVVDFIHLRFWPVFNVADVLLVSGTLLLVIGWRRARPRPPVPGAASGLHAHAGTGPAAS